ncbi:MAG TPA: response regulator transcription factor [Bryobacteraceae bacterium]|nr:response regulator transcription factor [Bryobacteraceae bacterium]
MKTIIVCETEPIAVEGLRNLLEPGGEFGIVSVAESLEDAMDAVQVLAPSILLLDKAFGIHNIMDCLQSVRRAERPTATVVWGVAVAEAEALHLLQAGAAAVIRKTAPLSALIACMNAVAAGGTWVEAETRPQLDGAGRSARASLTARELQVMELVERGLKNRDIGVALGIRTGTVKIHLKHIFEKTGVRGRYGLALTGLKEKGLLAATLPEFHT